MRGIREVFLGLILVLLCGHSASAETPEGSPEEVRRAALYREGIALADAGRWKDAVQRFREVVAIRSAPPALFTLAQAEEHLGELATAERTYERTLSEARAAGITNVADAAKTSLSAIEPRVPRIIVRVPIGVENPTAMIDGATAPLDEPVKVNPGDRFVSVSAPGRAPFRSTLHVAEGESRNVLANLPPISSRGLPPPPTASDGQPTARAIPLVPIVLGGAGIVAGAVGLTARLVGQSRYDNATASCPGGVCPSGPAGTADAANANAARTVVITGTVLLGVGGAALASAAIVWLVQPRTAQSPALRAGLSFSTEGTGLSLTGRF
jgi:hypothetical protein